MTFTVWNSPEEIQRDIRVFFKICLVFLGIYGWEFLTSLSADFEILFGQRKFRPAQLVYFACRYSILGFLIGVNIAMEETNMIDCEALYRFNNLALGCTLGTASLLLMMRSLVVWAFDKRVMIPLLILSLAHWGIIFRDILGTHASWNVDAGTCAVDAMFHYWMAIEFIFTMALDFVILCVTVVGILVRLPMKSSVRDLILHDGLVYFFCAFFANLIPSILMLCHLNPVMDFMATPIAATITAIAATRSVRRLTGLMVTPPPSQNSKRDTSLQTPSHPPTYRNQPKDGYISTDTSSLSLTKENFPAHPCKARLSSSRNEKTDINQDINVTGECFEPRLSSKGVEHPDQIIELHWDDGGERSGDSLFVPSQVDDDRVSPQIPLKVSPPNAEDGIDRYRAPRVLTSHSGTPSSLDCMQLGPSDLELKHSHDISAIALLSDQNTLRKIDQSSHSIV
ncbi:hypothetical protein BS47DRAFT_1318435 [Hydnum rufescens UP504]|uniref:Uncharacterized protein n=1 Tax=Hydnum rufescens UP504 TaxID=1448309 RepID=A0A9P6AUH4_9AGAM|nr:hypothetical protein BS47DRAFT_1318435 [Hydnum rufescens UP504]